MNDRKDGFFSTINRCTGAVLRGVYYKAAVRRATWILL